MSSGWVHISPLPVPYPYYEIEKNPNPVKSEKTYQIEVGLDGYPWTPVLLPCLSTYIISLQENIKKKVIMIKTKAKEKKLYEIFSLKTNKNNTIGSQHQLEPINVY